MRQNIARNRGFTLIEIIVTLVILAILVSASLPSYMGARGRAYRAEALQILSEVKALAWVFSIENEEEVNVWPGTWADMGYPAGQNPQTENWNFSLARGNYPAMGNPPWSGCVAPPTCVNVTATARAGSGAAGLAPISLYLNETGEAFVQ